MSWLVFFIFVFIVSVFAVFLLIIFYHIGKFSYVGDLSKRVFLIFAMIDAFLAVSFFVLLVINHLLS